MFEFVGSGWSSGPVQEAKTFWARWRGIRAVPADTGVVISGSSVHGVGLRSPLRAIALDTTDVVVMVVCLKPGRVAFCRGAARMLELPISHPIPPIGIRLTRVRCLG